MRNIKPNLYRLRDISRCKTLAETYAEARIVEDKSKTFNFPVAGGENAAKKGKCLPKKGGESKDFGKQKEKEKFFSKKQ